MESNSNIPVVSVIVNCFNGEKFLKKAIQSILDQTYQNFEIIFWDNKSTDNSAKIIKSYNDDRIKYYYANDFTKLYEARHLAIQKSSGQFITFLDVDDWWETDKLEQQLSFFSNKKVGIVCSNFLIYKESSKSINKAHKKTMQSGYVLNELLKNYYVGLLTVMIRKEAYVNAGNYCDKDFHIIGDFDLTLRVCKNNELIYIEKPLATYRSHKDSESKKHLLLQSAEIKTWHNKFMNDEIFSKNINYPHLLCFASYLEALSYIINGERYKVMQCIRNIYGINLIKILILLLIPSFLIERLRG